MFSSMAFGWLNPTIVILILKNIPRLSEQLRHKAKGMLAAWQTASQKRCSLFTMTRMTDLAEADLK